MQNQPVSSLQCQVDVHPAATDKQRTAKSGRTAADRHHFCVNHKAADPHTEDGSSAQSPYSDLDSSSLEADAHVVQRNSHQHTSRRADNADREQKSRDSSPAKQTYEEYQTSAVTKLVNELVHKQRECRKAKLQAAVST